MWWKKQDKNDKYEPSNFYGACRPDKEHIRGAAEEGKALRKKGQKKKICTNNRDIHRLSQQECETGKTENGACVSFAFGQDVAVFKKCLVRTDALDKPQEL